MSLNDKKVFSFSKDSNGTILNDKRKLSEYHLKQDLGKQIEIAKKKFHRNQLKRFKNIFKKFDINNDGTISIDEMYEIMKQIGIKLERKELVEQIKRFDYDENNKIDFNEFLCLMSILINETNPDLELQEAFDLFDINGDSFITKEDLKEFLKRNELNDKSHNELIKDIIKFSDLDGDSRISFEEFYVIYKYTTMINDQFDVFSKKRQKSRSLVKNVKLYR